MIYKDQRTTMSTGDEYEEVYESYDWKTALDSYDWNAPEELNIAHEACDRHAGSGNVGFAWVSEDGDLSEYTFAELRDAPNRVANALTELGIERGDRVTTLLPKIPRDDHHHPGDLEDGRDPRPALYRVRETGLRVPDQRLRTGTAALSHRSRRHGRNAGDRDRT